MAIAVKGAVDLMDVALMAADLMDVALMALISKDVDLVLEIVVQEDVVQKMEVAVALPQTKNKIKISVGEYVMEIVNARLSNQ